MIASIRTQVESVRMAADIWSLAILVGSLLCSGCSGDPQLGTIRGLQEENKVLKKQLADLQAGGDSSIKALRKEYDDRLAAKDELHREKIAQLEKEISDLRLDQGAIERERLTLKGLLDRQPRLEDAKKVRAGMDVMVLALFLGLALLLLGYLTFRYRTIRDRLHFLTVQQVAELRHVGGGQ